MTKEQQELFDGWSKLDIYEAYLSANQGAIDAQKRYNHERLLHLETKQKVSKDTYIIEINDTWKSFICKNMVQYGEVYNQKDFDAYFSMKHYNIGAFYQNRLIAFGCVLEIDDIYAMCYSWNDGTREGKRAFAKGIDYILERFDGILFDDEYGNKYNKTKRYQNEIKTT